MRVMEIGLPQGARGYKRLNYFEIIILKVIVKDNIVSKELEAVCSVNIRLLRLSFYLFLNRNQTLDNDIIYFGPH
jgi:hypothetical protein